MTQFINKLSIVTEFDPLVPKYRFSLDPISEYMASLFIIDNVLNGRPKELIELERSINHDQIDLNTFVKENEFLLAFCDSSVSLAEEDRNALPLKSFKELFEKSILNLRFCNPGEWIIEFVGNFNDNSLYSIQNIKIFF